MRNETAPRTGMQDTVRKVSIGARIMDACLCALFVYLAATTTGVWQVVWIVSAVFCAWTAITAPIEKLPAIVKRVLGAKKA